MIFLSLSKNHTPWEQLRISGRGRSELESVSSFLGQINQINGYETQFGSAWKIKLITTGCSW